MAMTNSKSVENYGTFTERNQVKRPDFFGYILAHCLKDINAKAFYIQSSDGSKSEPYGYLAAVQKMGDKESLYFRLEYLNDDFCIVKSNVVKPLSKSSFSKGEMLWEELVESKKSRGKNKFSGLKHFTKKYQNFNPAAGSLNVIGQHCPESFRFLVANDTSNFVPPNDVTWKIKCKTKTFVSQFKNTMVYWYKTLDCGSLGSIKIKGPRNSCLMVGSDYFDLLQSRSIANETSHIFFPSAVIFDIGLFDGEIKVFPAVKSEKDQLPEKSQEANKWSMLKKRAAGLVGRLISAGAIVWTAFYLFRANAAQAVTMPVNTTAYSGAYTQTAPSPRQLRGLRKNRSEYSQPNQTSDFVAGAAPRQETFVSSVENDDGSVEHVRARSGGSVKAVSEEQVIRSEMSRPRKANSQGASRLLEDKCRKIQKGVCAWSREKCHPSEMVIHHIHGRCENGQDRTHDITNVIASNANVHQFFHNKFGAVGSCFATQRYAREHFVGRDEQFLDQCHIQWQGREMPIDTLSMDACRILAPTRLEILEARLTAVLPEHITVIDLSKNYNARYNNQVATEGRVWCSCCNLVSTLRNVKANIKTATQMIAESSCVPEVCGNCLKKNNKVQAFPLRNPAEVRIKNGVLKIKQPEYDRLYSDYKEHRDMYVKVYPDQSLYLEPTGSTSVYQAEQNSKRASSSISRSESNEPKDETEA